MSNLNPLRPPTPQVLLHQMPAKPDGDVDVNDRPSKFIILLSSTETVAGKVQIAQSVAEALACPYFQGESLHNSSAKAASVGAFRAVDADGSIAYPASANEVRYQRMWLSKLTRTGLLFPNASRPANQGPQVPGGPSSATTSRRGSASSISSISSEVSAADSNRSQSGSILSQGAPVTTPFSGPPAPPVHNPIFTLPDQERFRRANPALMVLTHPPLEAWHKRTMRSVLKEHKIGIIFVPLYEEDDDSDEELPVLRPLDPRTMTSFPTLRGTFGQARGTVANLTDEMKVKIDTNANIEGQAREIVSKVKDVVGVGS